MIGDVDDVVVAQGDVRLPGAFSGSSRRRSRCRRRAPQPARRPASSFAWKDEPQPQAACTFGLLIAKPAPISASTKSISEPVEVRRAERVDDDADAVHLDLVVAVLRAAVEAERVLEARAAAALNRDREGR